MTVRRCDIVDAGTPGIYHCVSRCVRRESLLDDPARRKWLLKRLEFLTNLMAVDVISFAIMRNHIHLLLAIRPDIVSGWTDREVAERRIALLQNRRVRRRRGVALDSPPTTLEIDEMLSSPARVQSARNELCNLGFFHRLLKEPCARAWNRQDRVTGHFWEGRFKSPRVLDLQGLIQVARYIELNEVHAGCSDSAHGSVWTSASLQWVRAVDCLTRAIGELGDAVTPEGLGARLVQADWRPALPCQPMRGRQSNTAPAEREAEVEGRANAGAGWAGTALGLAESRVTLATHLEDLHISGQFARRDKHGWIGRCRSSPIRDALRSVLNRTCGRRPVFAEHWSDWVDQFVESCCAGIAEPRAGGYRVSGALAAAADDPLVAVSRGTCYGRPDSVAEEALRRGRARLWVGLVIADRASDVA